jgi:uncharacterized surface protein with fasciclin (FAS1) repeats
MQIRRTLALALAAAAFVTVVGTPAATRAAEPPSAVDILLSDGDTFDRNWYDFDILAVATGAVLQAKPGSPLAELADGSVPKTVFAPNDRAFQVLVASLTGRWYWTEEKVTNALLDFLGSDAIDTLEAVIRYHVLDAKVTWSDARALAPVSVATNLGPTIDVRYNRWLKTIVLKDKDPNALNPWVINSKRDINAANPQVIHGIALVLRPMDLPPLAR